MKQMITKISLAVAGFLVIALSFSTPLVYATVSGEIDTGITAAGGNSSPDPTTTLNTTVGNVVNLISVFVGVVAVIMIVVGGFRYITSGGDSTKVKSAKDTLLYAIIGLIIVALAQVIVRFVLNNATKTT